MTEYMDISEIGKSQGRESREELLHRAKTVFDYGFPSAAVLVKKFSGKAIIAGGGPSLNETLKDIRRQLNLSKRTSLFAVNKTHDWLIAKGLRPDFGVLIDPKPWVADYMTPTKGVTYLIGAKCHPDTFARFKNHPDVYHWHPLELSEELDYLSQRRDWLAVPGQSTVGLRTLPLSEQLGFTKFEAHAFDCNKRGDDAHMSPKNVPTDDILEEVLIVGRGATERRYDARRHMVRQLGEFKDLLVNDMPRADIKVAGDGALQYWAALSGPLHVNQAYNDKPSVMPHFPAASRVAGFISPPIGITVLSPADLQSQIYMAPRQL